MTPLKIERTETTPEICLDSDNKVFYMRGESLPENSFKFYAPILNWIDDYKDLILSEKEKHQQEISFEFFFEYINSSSIKFLFDILRKIEEMKSSGFIPKIIWKYAIDDDDMKENGEELKNMYNNLHIDIVEVVIN